MLELLPLAIEAYREHLTGGERRERFLLLSDELKRLRVRDGEVTVPAALRDDLCRALWAASRLAGGANAIKVAGHVIEDARGKPVAKVEATVSGPPVFLWDDAAVASATVLQRAMQEMQQASGDVPELTASVEEEG